MKIERISTRFGSHGRNRRYHPHFVGRETSIQKRKMYVFKVNICGIQPPDLDTEIRFVDFVYRLSQEWFLENSLPRIRLHTPSSSNQQVSSLKIRSHLSISIKGSDNIPHVHAQPQQSIPTQRPAWTLEVNDGPRAPRLAFLVAGLMFNISVLITSKKQAIRDVGPALVTSRQN